MKFCAQIPHNGPISHVISPLRALILIDSLLLFTKSLRLKCFYNKCSIIYKKREKLSQQIVPKLQNLSWNRKWQLPCPCCYQHHFSTCKSYLPFNISSLIKYILYPWTQLPLQPFCYEKQTPHCCFANTMYINIKVYIISTVIIFKVHVVIKGRNPSNGELSDFSFYIDSQKSAHRKFKK
jgi:hypothetical protein